MKKKMDLYSKLIIIVSIVLVLILAAAVVLGVIKKSKKDSNPSSNTENKIIIDNNNSGDENKVLPIEDPNAEIDAFDEALLVVNFIADAEQYLDSSLDENGYRMIKSGLFRSLKDINEKLANNLTMELVTKYIAEYQTGNVFIQKEDNSLWSKAFGKNLNNLAVEKEKMVLNDDEIIYKVSVKSLDSSKPCDESYEVRYVKEKDGNFKFQTFPRPYDVCYN